MKTRNKEEIRQAVRESYGKVAKAGAVTLKTNQAASCCNPSDISADTSQAASCSCGDQEFEAVEELAKL